MSRRAFTLVELLVATALAGFLIATATTAVFQMRTIAKRVLIRQDMHDTARIVFERLNQDVSSETNTAAFFVTSATGPGSIELVFLRGKYTPMDFMISESFGASAGKPTDLVWTRWLFDDATGRILVSSSTPVRRFAPSTDWINPTGTNYKNKPFVNLPTPQRAVAADGLVSTTLNANRYGSGAPEDIGDYQDLVANAMPIAANMSRPTVELVLQDGTVRTFTTATADRFAADGLHVDGRVGPAAAKRVRLVRVRFTLIDPRLTTIRETFSFSVQAPALLAAP